MALAQAGDRQAYRALLEDLGPAVMAYLRRRLANPQEVDDVSQEVLLAIHVSRHTYDPRRPLEPWVFAIAGHVLARHIRRSRRRATREVLVDVPPVEQVETGEPSLGELCGCVYPNEAPWTPEQLASHLRVFPEGQFVALDREGDRVVGMSANLIVRWARYD